MIGPVAEGKYRLAQMLEPSKGAPERSSLDPETLMPLSIPVVCCSVRAVPYYLSESAFRDERFSGFLYVSGDSALRERHDAHIAQETFSQLASATVSSSCEYVLIGAVYHEHIAILESGALIEPYSWYGCHERSQCFIARQELLVRRRIDTIEMQPSLALLSPARP